MVLSLVLGSVGAEVVPADEPPADGVAGCEARIYGVVTAVGEESLALATPLGAVTVVVDANTLFRAGGGGESSPDDLEAGDVVAAAGRWEEQDVFFARGVVVLARDRLFPVAGQLTEIGDGTLAIETEWGEATVRVDGDTVYRVRGVEDAGLDDLETGTKVAAKGTLNADGSLQAQVVGAAGAGTRRKRLMGEVVAVEGSVLVLRTLRGGEVSALTDESTEFRVPGVENATVADVQVGDRVAGAGTVGEDGTPRALLVIVLPAQLARLSGQVAGAEGTTLLLDTGGGRVRLLTDGETVFRIPGIEHPSLDDVRTGDRVNALGTWEGEASFDALAVGVTGRGEGRLARVRGRVVSVSGRGIVVGTADGPVTVLVNDGTRIRVPGVSEPDLDDVQAGAVVGVRGEWGENGSLLATHVVVVRDRQEHSLRDVRG
jgi:hypothetical protein